jgi:hypothetical protein
VETARKLSLGEVLTSAPVLLREPRRFRRETQTRLHIGERLTPPHGQCLTEQRRRGDRVTGVQ